MFGLTDKGFKRKRYADIITDMENRAVTLFGPNVNLSEKGPLGIFIRLVAWVASILWELAEKVYNSGYVDTAEGVQLEHVGKYIGIKRREAIKASIKPDGTPADVVITGDAGTSLEAGFIVGTKDGINYETIEAVILDVNGQATAKIRALEPGTSGNVPANTIIVIVEPTAGISAVNNPDPVTGGLNEEIDKEFKEKYDESVAKGGSSTVDSIRASLLNEVEGVRAALVIENDTMNDDAEGRPGKSISCYVLGGARQDIAKKILERKAGGIQAYGSEQEIVYDIAGNPHTIGFTYAQQVTTYIKATLTTNDEYPSDGDEQVLLSILKYIGGFDAEENYYKGTGMGEDVVYAKCINACFAVPGVDDVTLTLSTDNVNFAPANIPVSTIQVAETDYNKVVITHV